MLETFHRNTMKVFRNDNKVWFYERNVNIVKIKIYLLSTYWTLNIDICIILKKKTLICPIIVIICITRHKEYSELFPSHHSYSVTQWTIFSRKRCVDHIWRILEWSQVFIFTAPHFSFLIYLYYTYIVNYILMDS